jgi:hypothetical protein
MADKPYEVRKNTEFILIVNASSAEAAIKRAEETPDEDWEQARSPIEAEPLDEES